MYISTRLVVGELHAAPLGLAEDNHMFIHVGIVQTPVQRRCANVHNLSSNTMIDE